MSKNYFNFFGELGFDNKKYLEIQTSAILERITNFHKLYLEFGGKLLYDYHAARVLPGYHLDAKMEIIKRLAKKRKLEFLFCVSAKDLESEKKMGALGITYKDFSFKMINSIRNYGFHVPNVVINLFSGERTALDFGSFLKKKNYNVYYRDIIPNYPKNIEAITSVQGYGKKPFIKTENQLVIVTGAGPNSGKMGTCLAMIYQDYLCGKDSGYAKFESFPVWQLPVSSAINIAYEAATANIGDYNCIDRYHSKAYKIKAVNYNRDVANFEIIQKIIKNIISQSNFMHNYNSPTDMGINCIYDAIIDRKICENASRQEIIRRYFTYRADFLAGATSKESTSRVQELMKKYKIEFNERQVIKEAQRATEFANESQKLKIGCAIMLSNHKIITGKNSTMMHAESAAIINALKALAGIKSKQDILQPEDIKQIRVLRKKLYDDRSENLNIPEILIVLAISAKNNKNAADAFAKIEDLHSSELHTTHMLSKEDMASLRALGINFTTNGKTEVGKLHIGV